MIRKLLYSFFLLLAVSLISVSQAEQYLADVEFYYNDSQPSIALIIKSPVDIGAFQIKLEIPSNATIKSTEMSGFMSDSIHLNKGSEHRWFQIGINGGKEGKLVIQLEGCNPKYVKLLGVNLKDVEGSNIPIASQFPQFPKSIEDLKKPTPGFELVSALVAFSLVLYVFRKGSGKNKRKNKSKISL